MKDRVRGAKKTFKEQSSKSKTVADLRKDIEHLSTQ